MQPCSHEAMHLAPHHSLRSSITPLPHHPLYLTGIRIELGEIESALLKHKDIKEAVVIIGGNSLGLIQVNFKLKEILKQDIPALIMFEYPTIASLIRYLQKNLEDSTAPARDYEEKDRREKTGRGQNKMRQRKGKLKQIRIQ